MLKSTMTINCDTCGKDISPAPTNYPSNYILKLSSWDVGMRPKDGFTFSCLVYPPIDNDLYFCDLKCVSKYMPEGQ